MKLVTMKMADDQLVAGVVVGADRVAPLTDLGFASVHELIDAGPDEWESAEAAAPTLDPKWSIDEVTLAAPIPRTVRNLFAVGANYREHWDEGVRPDDLPDDPMFFTKPWTSLTGHGADVFLDRKATNKVDWEAEVAIVIGRGGRNIDPADAYDHVFGYVLVNDLSARELQLEYRSYPQWFKGKSLDDFCPMGPYIVTAPDMADPEDIHVELTVNGVPKQQFVTASMVHDIPAILARLSLGMDLLPGDIVLTGTSSGVGHWREPPEFLGHGDVVEMTSNVLGTLRFRTVEH